MIRKAVYSFFSHPFRTRPGYAGFATLEDFLNAWTLSVHLACQHFENIELVTDQYGKSLLVDGLCLPFTSIRDELDLVVPIHVQDIYWTFGKLWAYAQQAEPFIHIDYDVFLWKKPPERILQAPIFGQNTESHIWNIDIYRQGYMAMCAYLQRKPSDWVVTYPHVHRADVAINAGILGGNDVEFLKQYAATSIEMIVSHENKSGFEIIKTLDQLVHGKIGHGCNVITEQYLYARMCLSKNRCKEIEFLLDERETFSGNNPHCAVNRVCQELGYTHLIALPAKQNPHTMRRLKNRIKTTYPVFHRRIEAITRDVASNLSH